MATRDVAIGMKTFWMGDIADDGGFSTELEKVSFAVIDTPIFTLPEGDKTDFEIEDSDDPYFSSTKPGAKTFAISFYGLGATVLEKFFGGTAIVGPASGNDTWEAPLQIPAFETSILAEHTQGGHLKITRASVVATMDWAFQKNNLPKINLVATVLTPTKENEPPYRFSTAPYVP